VTLYTQTEGGAVREQLALGARLLHVPEAYLHYLAKTFWPVGLSVFYPHPAVADPESMRLVPALVGGGLLGAMSFGIWRLRHSFPELLVGWLWFLGTLVPVIGLIQVGDQAYADRYMYLPGIGLLLTLLAMPGLLRVSSRTVPVAGASLLLLLSIVIAHQQVGFWKDSAALWGRALAVTERNAQAHLGLGNAFANSNRSDEAIAQFEKALEIDPGFHAAHTSLGVEFLSRGELEEARAHLERAIEIDPDLASGHFFLSATLFAMDSVDPARAALERAKQIDPETDWNRLLLQLRRKR
jgi:tetratricopeptide (TPR) repeat protein